MAINIPNLDQDDVNALVADQLIQIKRRDKALILLQREIEERDETISSLEERLAAALDPTAPKEPVTPGDLTPEKEENTAAAPTPTPS